MSLTADAGFVLSRYSNFRSLVIDLSTKRQTNAVVGFYERKAKVTEDESQLVFFQRAAALGKRLKDAGTSEGDSVVIASATPRFALLSYLGATLIGAVPAILSVRPAFDDKDAIAGRVADAVTLLGSKTTVVSELRGNRSVVGEMEELKVLHVDVATLTPMSLDQLEPVSDAFKVAHIQLTSGSTGSSKAVAVTHASLMANIAAIADRCEYDAYGVFVGWLPLYHDMGLVSQALSAIASGMDTYMMSPFDFLADPVAWLRLISEKRGTVSASPSFGYDVVTSRVTDAELATLDLSSWKSACCGAEPISADVAHAFIERFSVAALKATAFTPCYGLAEVTLAVTMDKVSDKLRTLSVVRSSLTQLDTVELVTKKTPVEDQIEVVALGQPVAGLTVSLIDAAGNEFFSDLVCGEVVVSGTSVASGWITGPETSELFGAQGVKTGDVGFFHKGDLFVVERIKNVIIRNGENYSAAILEQTLADLTGISTEKIVVLDLDLVGQSRLAAIVELEDGDPLDLREMVQRGVDQFTPPLNTLVVVKRGALPRTTSGKKKHMETRERFHSGELKVIEEFAFTAPEIDLRSDDSTGATEVEALLERDVLELITEQVRLHGITNPVLLGSRLQYDLDVDSLGLLELAMLLEDHFTIALSRETVASLKTVSDVVNAVSQAKVSTEASAASSITKMVKEVRSKVPQYYTVADAVLPNRIVSIGGRQMDDFASGCYMGLDEDERVIAASAEMTKSWGLQRGWTRAVATPRPLLDLEKRLAELVGVPDVMIFGTVTLLHFGVLPLLAGTSGSIIVDTEAHKSMHEASALARAKGTFVTSFKHGDIEDLELKLQRLQDKTSRIVVLDGVYSMKGHTLDLPEYQRLAEKYDAILYIDDAHGFGMLGENPTEEMPYGFRGNGMVKHLGASYDRIVYVGGLTKAYSAMLAFVTCSNEDMKQLFRLASTMIFVHAPPTSTIAQAHSVLDINETEGAEIRARIYAMSRRLIAGAKALGFEVRTSAFPIVNVIMGDLDRVIEGSQTAWRHGQLITPAVFPAAPLDRGGLRFTVTATNTQDQIDRALAALKEIADARQAIPESFGEAIVDLEAEVSAELGKHTKSPLR